MNNNGNYRDMLFDDCDSDSDGVSVGADVDADVDAERSVRNHKFMFDDCLDTQWITEYETQFLKDEYRLFLKTDVTSVIFEFYYLDHHRTTVEHIVPMNYSLQHPNQITQNELFSIIRSHQHLDKKYYNFHVLLFYSYDFRNNKCKDVIREMSQYLRQNSNIDDGANASHFIEYTNILSIDTIHISPVLTMFHHIIGFSVLLYED